MAQSNNNILVEKLNSFIKKYYKNQLIKGGLYTIGLISIIYLSIVFAEYIGDFDSGLRLLLLLLLVGTCSFVLVKYIAIPLLKLNKLGKILTHDEAAKIIGDHFGEVSDKLLNVLQLQSDNQLTGSPALLEASINQRINHLSPVPFGNAVNFKENIKYIKFALPPVALLLLIWLLFPAIISSSTEKIVHYNESFTPMAPFRFNVVNENLKGLEQEDFDLEIEITGNEIPNEVYIQHTNGSFRLKKKTATVFAYSFKKLQSSIPFELNAGGFSSEEYLLKVIPKPQIVNFNIGLTYPNYLKKEDRVKSNNGDLIIPEGTKVDWTIYTKNANQIDFISRDSVNSLNRTSENTFQYSKQYFQSQPYVLAVQNEEVVNKDTLGFSITIIHDQAPTISVSEEIDSTDSKVYYFSGDIGDDYGFTRLTFNQRLLAVNPSESAPFVASDLGIRKAVNNDVFYHYWNISQYNIKPGDKIEYYFEVWDNDGVNGAKSAKSMVKIFKAPTLAEISDQSELENSKLIDDLEDALLDSKKLQKELKAFEKKFLEEKDLGWEEKKRLKEILESQRALEQKIENVQNQFRQNLNNEYEYRKPNPSLLEKQEQLQRLFDEVMTDEMKEMFEKMDELMDEMNKDQMEKMLEQMTLNDEDIEKELDRSLEIFKQLEYEKKMNETIEKLDELSKKQKDLASETEKNKNNKDAEKQVELKEKQEALNEEFDDIKKDIEDLKKKNEDLENKNPEADTEDLEKKVDEEMKESSDQLENNKNKKASKSQKQAAEDMQEMSQQMKENQQQGQEEASEEDINEMRQLLENIVQLSFDEEGLFTELRTVGKRDPKYTRLSQQQRKLKDDAKMIEDSLFALSKRVPQLQAVVNREINVINKNIAKSLEHMAERQTPQAASKQQFVMTSLNNLALLMDEVVQQMQKQMSQQKFGSSSCSKPGSSSMPMGNLKKLQQQLSKQLGDMQKGMQPGNSQPGGKKPGKDGQSKKLAQMAAKQQMIRNELRKMSQEMGENGSGGLDGLKKIERQMEKNEQDIVNQNITRQTLKRQEHIITKMLDFEKAEKERELDSKRESKEANNFEKSNPNSFFEYNRIRRRKVELLRTVPATLNSYYRNKVNEYFNSLEKD